MEILYKDTCNSQYFSGSSLPVVQVMVDCTTTYAQIKTELLSNQATEHLEEINDEEYKAAVEVMFDGLFETEEGYNELWDPTLNSMDEVGKYDCYAYFVIENSGLENYE